MDPKRLLSADYLDIIYDHRNKNYGGYELRKHYDARTRKALLLTFSVIGALLCFSFISSHRNGNEDRRVVMRENKMTDIKIPVHPIVIPREQILPPAAPKQVKTKLFTDPVVVSIDIVPPDKQMAQNKDIVNTQQGPQNRDGDPADLDPGKNIGTGTGLIDKPHSSEPVRFVEQMPQFAWDIGGYLDKNIHYPESARSNGIKGRVVVEFIVNEDGSVSNAKIMRGIGGGCDEEALRVVSNMPKWKPGKHNGIPVKVYFMLPIMFQLD